MMKAAAFITLLLLCVHAVPAVEEAGASPGACDFSGMDLGHMVDIIAGKLPPEYSYSSAASEHTHSHFEQAIPGLFLGGTVVKGIDKFQPYGPAIGYCRNGSRLVQVDFITAKGLVEVVMPWKTCGGQNGTIGTRTGARFSVTFKVVQDPAAENDENAHTTGQRLVLEGSPIPVHMDDVSVFVTGVEGKLRTVIGMLGKLFNQIPKEMCIEWVSVGLRNSLRNASTHP